MKKQLFVIYYDNGESYSDHWSGVDCKQGVFETEALAQLRIKELQKEHDFRIKDEIDQGYSPPCYEKETWNVLPIDYHPKS